MDIQNLTLTEARDKIRSGELSPQDLAGACFRQIERLNPKLNAFITVMQQPQKETSISHEMQNTAGNGLKPLEGLPIAVKDLYDTAGVRTTYGSLFFKDHVPAVDAAVVQKIRAAGATIVGKANTHEIALGLTNVNPHYGACRNPWDQTRVSGGSSGGSSASVASGMALASIGSDTGGSIRVPAALCGVTGLKPTYGRVSLRGVMPLSWNLDHAGPIARTARDAALMLQVMAGYDEADPTSVDLPVDDYLSHIEDGVRDWTVGFATGGFLGEADPDVTAAIRAAAQVFPSLGARVIEFDGDWLREAAQTNALMVVADGAAFHYERLAEHPDWFGADVRQRLESGAAYSSGDYARARRVQTEMRRKAELFFREHDLMILPSTPNPAPRIEGADAIEQARRLTRFTAPFNLTGLPAISVPCGFVNGLPVGLQIVAGHWQEANLLRAAHAYQTATDWHTRRPVL